MSNQSSIILSNLNLRQQPMVDDANVITVIPQGERIRVLGNDGAWLYVQRENGQKGYVRDRYTRSISETHAEVLWTTQVTAGGLQVKREPSADSENLAVLSKGTRLAVVGHQDAWLQVRHDAQDGYVSSKSTRSQSPEEPLPTDLDGWMAKARLTAEEIHGARQSIAAIGNPEQRGDFYEALQAKVIYRSQRDNEATDRNGVKIETPSGAMCNLTSLAMCLDYLGISNPHPDLQYEDALEKIRVEAGLPDRTSSTGWGGVAKELGAKARIPYQQVTRDEKWYTDNIRPVLREGWGVMLSIGGHIVRMQAVTKDGLVVDDPFGQIKLKPGEQGAWSTVRGNAYGKAGPIFGEDVVWPWADVRQHTMRWIAQIETAVPREGFALQPEEAEPIIEIEDDAIVIRDADQPDPGDEALRELRPRG